MKNLKSTVVALIVVALPFISFGQINNLNIPSDLLMSNQPTSDKTVVLNVLNVESACIQMFASNPSVRAKRLNQNSGNVRMNQGKRTFTLAMVKLQSISSTSDATSFNFGLGCGEEGVDDANVLISSSNGSADRGLSGGGNTPIKLDLPANEILTVSADNMPGSGNKNENYLRVNADRESKATIRIDQDARKGQVIVAVFRVQGNPNPIAVLDPKSASAQSVTVDQDVYVVPIIRPKLVDNAGNKNILFEVGDPHENGRVEIDEEG